LLALAGSGRRTSFITSLNLAQMSEFSLVIASLGLQFGHISRDILSIALYAMALTSVASSYFIKFNHQIYQFFNRGLKPVLRGTEAPDEPEHPHGRSIVLLGFHRGARVLVDTLARERPEILDRVLVVDFSVELLRPLESMGIRTVFGDISRSETLRLAGIERAGIIVSTIPDMLLRGTDNARIVRTCRALAPDAIIIATADLPAHADALRAAGANEVILPYSLAGEHAASRLLELTSPAAVS
jgi:hypothetical protein